MIKDDPRTWRLTALEPVWVPHPPDYVADATKPKRGRRASGPNGEDPDSGKWRLRWPKMHPDFGGTLFEGETISVSALDTAAECLSKWGWGRVYGYEEPENRKAALGNLRHDELERWEHFGTAPTTAGMAGVLAHFPAPGAESEVFFGFAIERPDGSLAGEPVWKRPIVIAGWVDCRESAVVEDESGWVDSDRLNSVIYDLKTTGDFRWKKTPAQLKANIQAAAYALGEMLKVEAVRGPGANGTEMVLLRWVYAQLKELTDKKLKDSTPVEKAVCEITRVEMLDELEGSGEGLNGVWIDRETALAVVAQYVPLADTLLDILAAPPHPTRGLPKNRDSCESYGGCPWKKIDVEVTWEDVEKIQRLVGSKIVTIEKKETKTKREKVCTPPAVESGSRSAISGFMAKHRQEMAKKSHGEGIGGHAGVEKVLGQWSEQQTQEKVMGLADRFAGAVKTQVAPTETPKPVETPKVVETPKPSGGLAGRFAGVAKAPDEVKTGDVKATSDGMASSGGAAQSGGATLANRLQALRKGNTSAAAVDNAVANAPTRAVSKEGATGQLAVGINPPDAAPEWTQEQQIAEGERLAAAGKTAESGEMVTDGKATAGTAATAATTEAPKRRGRPPGSTKAATISKEVETAIESASEGGAIPVLELLAKAYLDSGRRREATVLLKAAEQLEAIAGNGVAVAA